MEEPKLEGQVAGARRTRTYMCQPYSSSGAPGCLMLLVWVLESESCMSPADRCPGDERCKSRWIGWFCRGS